MFFVNHDFIGDIPYKGFIPGQVVHEPFAWPDDHNQVPYLSFLLHLSLQIFSADLVIPNPEFVSLDLTEEDEFMILASDGLWDVVKRHEACSRVRYQSSYSKVTFSVIL